MKKSKINVLLLSKWDEDGELEDIERTFKIERIDFIRTSYMP